LEAADMRKYIRNVKAVQTLIALNGIEVGDRVLVRITRTLERLHWDGRKHGRSLAPRRKFAGTIEKVDMPCVQGLVYCVAYKGGGVEDTLWIRAANVVGWRRPTFSKPKP
jgi:hypothetical protein